MMKQGMPAVETQTMNGRYLVVYLPFYWNLYLQASRSRPKMEGTLNGSTE
ncbi:hypothetical protein LIT38_11100 [Bacillus sp. CMF12]|nr:hypothetical protein [Bacillus sp. CMF12]USK51947.1 hypothetical protein LIT38_11100 [Bacillus sp. CMF12]